MIDTISVTYCTLGSFRVNLCNIDWQSVGALATLAAVIVALFPICRDAQRKKAHARSLRFRLCSKLTILKPSLGKVVQSGRAQYAGAILAKDEFREAVRSVAAMLQESSVLQPEEQDLLGVVLANLEIVAVLYETSDLSPKSVQNTLAVIGQAITIMEKHKLLHGHFEKPWNN